MSLSVFFSEFGDSTFVHRIGRGNAVGCVPEAHYNFLFFFFF